MLHCANICFKLMFHSSNSCFTVRASASLFDLTFHWSIQCFNPRTQLRFYTPVCSLACLLAIHFHLLYQWRLLPRHFPPIPPHPHPPPSWTPRKFLWRSPGAAKGVLLHARLREASLAGFFLVLHFAEPIFVSWFFGYPSVCFMLVVCFLLIGCS